MNELDREKEKGSIQEANEELETIPLLYDDDANADVNNFHQKLEQIFKSSSSQKFRDFTTLLFSTFIFLVYVISTYHPQYSFYWFDIVNHIIATIFNLETIINIYLERSKCEYILSMEVFIDLFTSIFPYFVSIKNLIMVKLVQASRVFHLFRISRLIEKYFIKSENLLMKHILSMALKFSLLIFVECCIIRIVEIEHLHQLILDPNSREYSLTNQTQLHHFLYCILITFSTIGYGDLYPTTELGRILIIILILISWYLLPKELGELFPILENTSVYSRDFYKASKTIPHLVIVGNITVDAMRNFCDELFHSDHGDSSKNVVILHPDSPDQKMKIFLHSENYNMSLRYLEGNPLLDKDRDRADICKAKTIVVMTNKYTSNPIQTDLKNIFIALSIKKYLFKRKVYNTAIYLQIIKPENQIYYLNGARSYSLENKVSADKIIVVEEIKMNLLSKSCLIPGIIPFIANLVSSSGQSNRTNHNWMNEYLEGSGQEIYRIPLNNNFKGKTFAQISKVIFEQFNAIAFALEFIIGEKAKTLISPANFFVGNSEEETEINFYVYVICDDQDVADKIALAGQEDKESDLLSFELEGKEKEEQKTYRYSSQHNLKLALMDLIKLEENRFNNKIEGNDEDDYFFIKSSFGIPPDVKKDSIENSSIYTDHIVVCGVHPSLYYYLLPLRERYFGKQNLKYVVILTRDMPKDIWDSISRFQNILLINGSALCSEDLNRANIKYAAKAVILEGEGDKKIGDFDKVLIYKAIKKANSRIQVLNELFSDSNIINLLPLEELEEIDIEKIQFERSSVFSSGEVYLSSIIDYLTSQAYYNQHIVSIIRQLLTGTKKSEKSLIKSVCENIDLSSSNLWQIEIPEKFIGRTFRELYEDFCKNNLIALGLYRLPGARDNRAGYVYTKPEAETKLSHRDKIFVLAVDGEHPYLKKNRGEEDEGRSRNRVKRTTITRIDDAFEFKLISGGNGTPFAYLTEEINRIEKQTRNLEALYENTRLILNEAIATGIKQEIISLLN